VAIFCQTKQVFAGRNIDKVKKMSEAVRQVGLFGPDNVSPNQLPCLKIIQRWADNEPQYKKTIGRTAPLFITRC
jgi:hypothetical protein